MRVILKERVEKLGEPYDTVNVKDGFARNFLFPRGLAMEATKGNLARIEEIKRSRRALQEREKNLAQELAKKLENVSFTLTLEANVDDRLYGSVDTSVLAEFLSGEGYQIDKKNIILDEPIKSLGIYQVDVKLHPEVMAKIKVWIVKK
jgi:large subunit ribosomal protein L9